MCSTFKKRAPKVIKEIRKSTQRLWEQLLSGWMLSLTSMSGVVGFRVGQGEFLSILSIREMMKKMLGGVFLTSHCCKDPSRGLKGIGYQGH